MNTERLRIAHISDLHFAAPTFSPFQFFSKRWVGNCFQIVSRKNYLDPLQIENLGEQFHSLSIDTVLITGDLTTTTRKKELRLASTFIKQLQNSGLRVITIPGNHDHYTKRAWRTKLFYRYFSDYSEHGLSLKEDGLALIPLHKNWTLLALDTACATALFSSQGHFHPKTEEALQKILSTIPSQQNIILMNHFPLFEHERHNKTLLRASALRKIIAAFPNIRFYIHGHTHHHCVADLRASHYPIILDSGSISQIRTATWNMLDLGTKEGKVHVFRSYRENKSREAAKTTQWLAAEPNVFQW